MQSQHAPNKSEAAVTELSLDELQMVAGGLPRGGWKTDPETGEPIVDSQSATAAVASAVTVATSDS